MENKKLIKFTYIQTIIIGFACMIFLGAILLSLPIASRDHQSVPLIDALFTATSAACVAGFLIYDTYTQWTVFGQIVIITLVQIGGIGFMTVATLFSLVLRRKIGLTERGIMKETTNILHIGGVVRVTKHALIGTVICEGLGAALLAIRFCPEMGLVRGLYNSVFHSISAFCNAGFDLMGRYEQFSSITRYSGDWFFNIVIATLIVIGGIGFIVWEDLYVNRLNIKRYMLHTKIVLFTTSLLIVIPAIMIFTIETHFSFADKNFFEAVMASFFQSITSRTAGFLTVDLTELSNGTAFIMMVLMLIGGSPGSTAGGIKTTTFFALVMSVIATVKNRNDITAFRRRFEEHALRKACAIFFVYMSVAVLAIIILSTVETFPLKVIMFEVFAAIGTVGCSMNVTASLSVVSKIVIMLLMYFGRIGVLSIGLAFAKTQAVVKIQAPSEKFIIG